MVTFYLDNKLRKVLIWIADVQSGTAICDNIFSQTLFSINLDFGVYIFPFQWLLTMFKQYRWPHNPPS
jgi:hypothetical protein